MELAACAGTAATESRRAPRTCLITVLRGLWKRFIFTRLQEETPKPPLHWVFKASDTLFPSWLIWWAEPWGALNSPLKSAGFFFQPLLCL